MNSFLNYFSWILLFIIFQEFFCLLFIIFSYFYYKAGPLALPDFDSFVVVFAYILPHIEQYLEECAVAQELEIYPHKHGLSLRHTKNKSNSVKSHELFGQFHSQ